jgi:hypothetical protein
MAKANVAEIKTWLTLFLTNLKPNTQMKEKNLATLPVSANGTMYPGHFILLLPMIYLTWGQSLTNLQAKKHIILFTNLYLHLFYII